MTVAELLADAGVQWPPDDPNGPRHELYGEVEPPALARAYVPAVESAKPDEPDDEPLSGVLTAWWNAHR